MSGSDDDIEILTSPSSPSEPDDLLMDFEEFEKDAVDRSECLSEDLADSHLSDRHLASTSAEARGSIDAGEGLVTSCASSISSIEIVDAMEDGRTSLFKVYDIPEQLSYRRRSSSSKTPNNLTSGGFTNSDRSVWYL